MYSFKLTCCLDVDNCGVSDKLINKLDVDVLCFSNVYLIFSAANLIAVLLEDSCTSERSPNLIGWSSNRDAISLGEFTRILSDFSLKHNLLCTS